MTKRKTRPITDYDEFTTVPGKVLHVYTPPMEIISGIVPTRPKPLTPKVEMETKGGTQTRLAKEGDPEYEEYQQEIELWERERADLQEAAKFVTALRDVEYPDPLSFPPHIQLMIDAKLIEVPDHPFLARMMWLRSEYLVAQNDEFELDLVIQKRTGVPEEVIEQIKANFRNFLRGAIARSVGEDANENGQPAERVDADEPAVQTS